MTQKIRLAGLGIAGVLGLTLLAPGAAHAGSKGKRNTALALGAVAAYGLITKKPLIAGAAGAGALYSYTQSRRDAGRERDRDRYRRYGRYDRFDRYDRYDRGYRSGGYDRDYRYDRGRYDDYDRYDRYDRDRDCDRRDSRRYRR